MGFDTHTNLAYALVATAPSPATSGTSLVVTAGYGATLGTPPFNMTDWATGAAPDTTNAEIVRVTAISTDTLTIVRAQEGTTARSIVVGDQIANTISVKPFTDIESSIPQFNVKYYGATGNGSTDDFTAVQAAITAAQSAGGGIVYFPIGTYVVSGTPQITGSNIILQGAGDASEILLGTNALNSSGTTIGLWVNGGSNIIIRDLQINGNSANIAQNGGFILPSGVDSQASLSGSLSSSAGATVSLSGTLTGLPTTFTFLIQIDSEQILATRSSSTLTAVLRGVNGTSAASHSSSAPVHQTVGSGSTGSVLFNATITKYGANTPKNYVYAGSGVDSSTYLKYRVPIRISNASNVLVENCLLTNSISAGVLVDSTSVNGTQYVNVTNNRINNTWDNGVYFHQGCQYCSATNNIISGITYNGVCAVYSDHILFSNNNISFCGPSLSDSGGVQINGSSNCSVTGNLVDQCQFYGIVCEASQETNITNGAGGNQVWSYNTVISNNNITGCHAADYSTHNSPGINFDGSDTANVAANTIINCDFGISMGQQAFNTSILNNRITKCTSIGINIGNSADVVNTIVKNNIITQNGSHGVYANAPGRYENNTITGNVGMGINLSSPPSGLPYKIDYIIGNTIFDNTDSGILTNSAAGCLAIVERNIFGNGLGVVYNDGVSNATTTMTSASASFQSSDVGLPVIVVNQGTGGTTTTTTIASVSSSTTVVLAGSLPGTQTGLTFYIGRGVGFFTGSTSGSTLTAGSGTFVSTDSGLMITVMSVDPSPVIIFVGTISSYSSSTSVGLSSSVGTYGSVQFFINRSTGQQARAINNFNGYPVIDRYNTFVGFPEILGGSGTINALATTSPYGTLTPSLKIPTSGSAASSGTATLSGGTLTVNTAAVTSSSLIFLQDTASTLTNVGTLSVSSKSAGTSFTVTSSNVLDTSTFNWFIIN